MTFRSIALSVSKCNVFQDALCYMVLEMFLLPAGGSLTFLQLGKQDLFGELCAGHADDMTCPSQLVLHYCGGNGFFQNTEVGTSVLSADLLKVSLVVVFRGIQVSAV